MKLAYKTEFQGIPISIENAQGSYRHWKDPLKGEEGRTYMHYAYGYIRGTEGADGEGVDVYLGPNEESPIAFIVRQCCPITGEYDEDKVMLGFYTYDEAKEAYMGQYDDPGFFGSMDSCHVDNIDDCTLPQPKLKYQEIFGAHVGDVIGKAKEDEPSSKRIEPKTIYMHPLIGAGMGEGIESSFDQLFKEDELKETSKKLKDKIGEMAK